MQQEHGDHSWFGASALDALPEPTEDQGDFKRLWQAFMTARLVLGVVLVILQITLYVTGSAHSKTLLAVCAAYFLGTLATRMYLRPRPLGGAFTRSWGVLIGIDVLAFSALQWLHGNSLNYTPLFALPVLLASVLGSLRLALGTAAGVTMLLLGGAVWTQIRSEQDNPASFVQAGLSGVGYFAIAFLANQLATRLANEGKRARQSQLAATIQREVNELVIEAMPEGVMIVDQGGIVRAANPAARQLLGDEYRLRAAVFDLKTTPAWKPLLRLCKLSLGSGQAQEAEVSLQHDGGAPLKVLARTRLAAPQGIGEDSLCVLFLQDQRQAEARLRTEKLASMGRMSTAVAHEIRNPLAAIAQANALLAEDLSDPKQLRLTTMVGQNAKRLEKIVDDILNVARARGANFGERDALHGLSEAVHKISSDWAQQHGQTGMIGFEIDPAMHSVRFDLDHLRQVMVNLLDNAHRYASRQLEAIQITVTYSEDFACVSVWSDGARMDQTVERHLFEPFFSSESRSSGLGLYISRELSERHSATLTYQRSSRERDSQLHEGNEFMLTLTRLNLSTRADSEQTTPWQASLY
ncbi:two-component system sensor histidine kinase NtrB [Rhodoferax mekongensis]|uniref:histidine kinase n=1 Tax=Rhodoferax mekongensis TaxID=3068341 RepID=A0ABZ0B2U6_9BURK|nr:ATP-binding protein [Rhodoferax sp. TBRC 17307]WNO05930.1 ATP-binding protein [Rhodoferax sp. TBRC 17307]